MYKAVFLDIGGVVLQIDWSKPFEYAGIFDPRRRMEILQKFQGSEVFHLYERGLVSTEKYLSSFNDVMNLHHPNPFWEAAWKTLIVGEVEGAGEIFDLLEGNVPVFAASNTNAIHVKQIKAQFPVIQRFAKFFASNEIGERKPDAAFYLKICTEAGVHPNEALFVDDTMENVEGARRVGLTAQRTVNSARETIEFLRSRLGLP